ncbi:MAG: sensor histidine kinase [Rubrivivax sp.]
MHSSLAELLENLKSGLLWVQRDGVVRYANGNASARTGLAPGRKVYDPDLARAVAATVAGQAPRVVNAVASHPGSENGTQSLACRVLPGLARDDAFVLIGNEAGDGSAFDNLMQVIRSDLRDPLKAAGRALEVARAPDDAHPTAALVDQVGELLRVLDKLVDLAELWGSGALFASDRIELWPLLQQVWGEVEPMAMDRGVKVRFRAQVEAASLATLYGSEHWWRRVFLECLEGALRSARHGATLEIEHRQLGPRALIVFRDSGVFAPRAGATDIELTKSGRKGAPRLAARDQIGLKLCQHIVSLHGGQLREEDEDGVRLFLIDLPTGAPARADNHELDIAQAQQYARDLAALMARARNRRGAEH